MINKVTLLGRLGMDGELKTLKQDVPMLSVSLATSEKYKDKSGNVVESTEWHNVKIFGKLATAIAPYMYKGTLIYLEGKIKTTCQEKDGVKSYYTNIIAHQIKLCSTIKTKDEVTAPKQTQSRPEFVPSHEFLMGEEELPF